MDDDRNSFAACRVQKRILNILGQVAFIFGVLFVGMLIFQNMRAGLAKQGVTLSYSFFQGIAGFDISETSFPYSRESSYWQAYLIGLVNTLSVSIVGVVFSTVFGVMLGVARLSTNFLINRLAAFYLELIRNLSLLVFLIFWYLGVFLKLPRSNKPLSGPSILF